MKIKTKQSLIDYLQSKNFSKRNFEKSLWFLSKLIDSERGQFRRIHSKLLGSAIGRNKKYGITYNSLLKILREDNVIIIDFNWSHKDKISKGYKLTEKYYLDETIIYNLTDTIIVNKILKAVFEKEKMLPEYILKMKENISELFFKGNKVEKNNISQTRTGRVFNYLSNSKRKERKYISLENDTLLELDISCAQPYLLINEIIKNNNYSEENLPEDVRNFVNLIKTGYIYDYFANKLNRNIEDKIERDKFKEYFFKSYFFNSKVEIIDNSKVGQIFKKEFSTIHNYIIKNYCNKNISLAFKLQSLESEIVINNFYKTCVDNDIWSITLHDAIWFKSSDKIKIEELFSFVFSSFSFLPNYKINTVGGTHLDIISNMTTQKEEGMDMGTNICSHFSEGVYQNKNNNLKDEKRKIILEAIEKLLSENKKINSGTLNKITGINKTVIIKHLKEINMIEEKKCGIYKITNPSNEIYIGSSNNIQRRFKEYKSLNCKTQPKLHTSFLKYGVENHNFEIIHICKIEELHNFEEFYGKKYNVKENGLNCQLPGDYTELKIVQKEMAKIKSEKILSKLNENYKKNITTSELSKLSRVSLPTVKKYWKEISGEELVNKKENIKQEKREIIIKAIEKLLSENKKITQKAIYNITKIHQTTIKKHLKQINMENLTGNNENLKENVCNDITPPTEQKVSEKGSNEQIQFIGDFSDLSDDNFEGENDFGKGNTVNESEEEEKIYDLSEEIPEKKIKIKNEYPTFQWFNGRIIETY